MFYSVYRDLMISWRRQPCFRPIAACVSGVYRDRLSNRVANVSLSSSVAYCVYRDHWGHGASPEMGPSVAVILQYIGISKISWRRPRANVRAKFAPKVKETNFSQYHFKVSNWKKRLIVLSAHHNITELKSTKLNQLYLHFYLALWSKLRGPKRRKGNGPRRG